MFEDPLFLNCLECQRFPLISYHNSELFIKCSCGYEKNLSIKNYVDKLRKRKHKTKIENNCIFHNNEIITSYCTKCELDLCKLC